MTSPFATILHRDTIAALVGARTYERGESVWKRGRVKNVAIVGGQLRGTVAPSEPDRAPYEVQVWIKDEGLAYRCTCPIGLEGRFCKHAVACALGFIDRERIEAEVRLRTLRNALEKVPHDLLLTALVEAARADARVQIALEVILARA